MKVLVTGGTGFVGAHTAKALKDAGHYVRLLVRSASKAESICDAMGFSVDEVLIGDITDGAAVEKSITGCDAVVHCAAMVSTAEKFADKVWQTNVGGTKIVMDCSIAAGVKKIIYVSSVSALFDTNDSVMSEESFVSDSASPYGRSKVACEHYVRELQDNGESIVITYPAGVVGAGDPGLSEPHFGIKMFVGQFTFTSSTGMQFVNVKDIAAAHVKIIERIDGPDRFMLAGHYYSWNELLEITRRVTGRRLPAIYIPGAVLRFLGLCADAVTRLTGKELPMTSEGMMYATQWVYADSSKAEKDLDLAFTCREQTLAEVIRWLYENKHLSAKKAGKLAN